jgi:NAD(P)-dependent dehydrogenase (short-subunit alcohol dehydrogenase family)
VSKRILITGCSNGFGYDAAKYLAKEGHSVYATMRGPDAKNKAAAAELRDFAKSEGLKLEVIELDVTSDESVKTAVAQVPTVDVLINNAGVGYGGPIEAFSIQEFQAQMDVNVTGTLRVAKAVLPGMRSQRSGLIIQVSSVAGRLATPGFGIYYCSKWALEGLSEALRYELGPLGIDVVLVEPGPFSTGFFANVVQGENQELNAEYSHVGEFSEGFGQKVQGAFEDENAPTDPMDIVKAFGKLIDTPAGQRPLRTLVGLDFGMQQLNDATEPIRKAVLAELSIEGLDGAGRS